jgi:KRAB domain-containing zinc finger protein
MSSYSLKKHLEMKHGTGILVNKLENFVCDFDGEVFPNKVSLFRHMRKHALKIKCEFCNAEFLPRTMKSHIKHVHIINQEFFNCQICQKSFKSLSRLTIHLKNHDKKIECKICSKMFPSQGYLNQHMKLHVNPNSFECEICDKKFNLKQTLQIHQKMHERNRSKPYKCQRCDYATDNKIQIRNHQQSHERQDKKHAAMKNPLKCELCPVLLRDKKTLRRHIKFVHVSNPHQCDLCGNYYKTIGTLKRHIYGHIKLQN